MFVRKSSYTRGDKTYSSFQLVESVRTPKGPRQRVVCSLGDLSPRSGEEWLRLARRVESSLEGQEEFFETPDGDVVAVVDRIQGR